MRKLVAVAVTMLVGAGIATADINVLTKKDTEVQIYGKAHLAVESYEVDGATSAADASGTRLQSHSSRLGFKGSQTVNEDLKAVFQVEAQVNFTGDDDPLSTGNDIFSKVRNSYIGLASEAAGECRFGRQDVAYKMVTGGHNLFTDSIGESDAIVSQGAGRPDDTVLYLSPKVAGGALQFVASYSFTPLGEYESDKLVTESNVVADTKPGSVASCGLLFKQGATFANAGFEAAEADRTAEGDAQVGYNSVVVSVGTKMGGTQVVGAYEHRANINDDGADQDNYTVGVAQDVSEKVTLKAAYGIRDVDVAEGQGEQITAGVSVAAAKNVEIYAFYTQIENEAKSAVNFSDGGIANVAAGEDISAVAVGMVYVF